MKLVRCRVHPELLFGAKSVTTLVTGATGLVGNNMVRQLLSEGQPVRVMVRQESDVRPLAGLEVERVYGDVREPRQVRAACQGARVVVHAAARVHFGWSDLATTRAINVGGTRHVAQASRSQGARMIHVSSVDALAVGSPTQPANEEKPAQGKVDCPYVVTKREAEQAVLAETKKGLDAVIVNPGFMLGPWDWKPSSGRMLLEVAKRFTPLAPSGGLSVCDVRDVVRAIGAAVERGRSGRRYILAGTNLRYYDLWCLMADVAGARRPVGRLGPVLAWLAGTTGDVITRITGHEPDVNSAGIRSASLYHYYSSARAEIELSYQMRPVRESVETAWQWFREHGYS